MRCSLPIPSWSVAGSAPWVTVHSAGKDSCAVGDETPVAGLTSVYLGWSVVVCWCIKVILACMSVDVAGEP